MRRDMKLIISTLALMAVCATSPKCPNANLRAMAEAICHAQS